MACTFLYMYVSCAYCCIHVTCVHPCEYLSFLYLSFLSAPPPLVHIMQHQQRSRSRCACINVCAAYRNRKIRATAAAVPECMPTPKIWWMVHIDKLTHTVEYYVLCAHAFAWCRRWDGGRAAYFTSSRSNSSTSATSTTAARTCCDCPFLRCAVWTTDEPQHAPTREYHNGVIIVSVRLIDVLSVLSERVCGRLRSGVYNAMKTMLYTCLPMERLFDSGVQFVQFSVIAICAHNLDDHIERLRRWHAEWCIRMECRRRHTLARHVSTADRQSTILFQRASYASPSHL